MGVIVNETTNIIGGCCPHPRVTAVAKKSATAAPLALSLDRERDLEMDMETESKNSQTRRMTARGRSSPAWSNCAVRITRPCDAFFLRIT
jgi:hypothetical protein